MKPAGFENSQGIISSTYFKDPNDAQWKTDAGMKAWNEFLTSIIRKQSRRRLVDVQLQCGPGLVQC
jgi:branched-chain amino acid transport system substrate-binding protein